MGSRWDDLLDTKPVPLLEHLLEEIAKRIAKELETWPPPIQEFDHTSGGQFAPLFEPGSPRPAPATYEEAFRLAQWELAHQLEAYDDYLRNRRWLERGLAPSDRLVLLFLSRWLLEQMLSLGEATEGRIKGAQMQTCLEKALRHLRHRRAQQEPTV